MTVGDLKAALATMPDDLEIVVSVLDNNPNFGGTNDWIIGSATKCELEGADEDDGLYCSIEGEGKVTS